MSIRNDDMYDVLRSGVLATYAVGTTDLTGECEHTREQARVTSIETPFKKCLSGGRVSHYRISIG